MFIDINDEMASIWEPFLFLQRFKLIPGRYDQATTAPEIDKNPYN